MNEVVGLIWLVFMQYNVMYVISHTIRVVLAVNSGERAIITGICPRVVVVIT